MKNNKCIKCGIYYKSREHDEEEKAVYKTLCWNCSFVWKTLGTMLQSIKSFERVNRTVRIHIDDIQIEKTSTRLKTK